MKDTIKLKNKKNTLIIAHRGASGLEKENTYPAFIAGGNRSYYGLECDVHKTIDGKYVIIHDDFTGRVALDNLEVEKSTYETLRKLKLLDLNGKRGRNDLRIPSMEEYFNICKDYNKVAVFEFKNKFEENEIIEMVNIINKLDYLHNTIFISFCLDNLLTLRKHFPNTTAQFLIEGDKLTNDVIELLVKHNLDIDCYYKLLNKENINLLHSKNIKINCWTVNNQDDAQNLIDLGVDFITSNILE